MYFIHSRSYKSPKIDAYYLQIADSQYRWHFKSSRFDFTHRALIFSGLHGYNHIFKGRL